MMKANDSKTILINGTDFVNVESFNGKYESAIKGFADVDGEFIDFKIQVNEIIPLEQQPDISTRRLTLLPLFREPQLGHHIHT